MLKALGLTKRFEGTMAVAGVSFAVERGQLWGIVGPDGAGKTSLLRLLAGVLQPTGGQLELAVPRNRIGYLSQHFSLYLDMTVLENIAFIGRVYGLHEQAIRRRGRYLLQWVGLWEARDRLGGQLSGGMKQKLSLVAALVHESDLLLLDEPTTAVDPVARREFWDLILELVQKGTAVVLSTPYMEEAARCHRVLFLHEGQVLATDTPAGLQQLLPYTVLSVRAPGSSRSEVELAARSIPNAVALHTFGDQVRVYLERSLTPPELNRLGLPAYEAEVVPPTLEDVFIWLMGGMEVAG